MEPKDARNIVAAIAQSREYIALQEDGNSQDLPFQTIAILLQKLAKIIDEEKRAFLASFGPKARAADVIEFKTTQRVQAAKDEFDRQLKKQMPIYVHLINLLTLTAYIQLLMEQEEEEEETKQPALAAC